MMTQPLQGGSDTIVPEVLESENDDMIVKNESPRGGKYNLRPNPNFTDECQILVRYIYYRSQHTIFDFRTNLTLTGKDKSLQLRTIYKHFKQNKKHHNKVYKCTLGTISLYYYTDADSLQTG